MPIWADPRRGERVRLLADDDMSLLATFVAPPGVRPTARDLAAVPGADLARMAEVAARDLPGVRVVTRLDEAAALADAGAQVVAAHAHMVRGLEGDEVPERWVAPALPAGTSLTGLAGFPGGPPALARAIAALQLEAYPADHPDRPAVLDAQADGSLLALLEGQLTGPVDDDLSALLLDADGRPVGCLVVTHLPRIPGDWQGGPWMVEMCRAPSLAPAPVGRAMFARALAVAQLAGHPAIGLSVNAANRARRLYQRFGFVDAFHRITLDLPGSWPA